MRHKKSLHILFTIKLGVLEVTEFIREASSFKFRKAKTVSTLLDFIHGHFSEICVDMSISDV